MKLRSAAIIGISAIVAVIAFASLSGSTQAKNQETIRVAHFANIGHAIPVVGMENGFFAKSLGNKTEIKPMIFDSGPQVIESLFSNSADMAYVGPGPAINGYIRSDQHNIRILAGAASGGASFVVHPSSLISSASDFDGKRIAAPQIGNSQDVSLRYYLSQNDLKPVEKGGTVTILNIANPEIYTLFAKGDIDGAWVPEPWATILVKNLGGKRLFYEEDLWPEKRFASVLLIAREEFVNENPELVKRWLEAHKETVEWINQNPDETVAVFNHFIEEHLGKKLDKKILLESLSNIKITSDPNMESVFVFAERANSLGYLGRSGYNIDEIFYDIEERGGI